MGILRARNTGHRNSRRRGWAKKTRLAVESLEVRRLLSADGVAPEAAPAVQMLPGDLDQDGKVGFADFLQLSANFGQTEATSAQGDIDNDQIVGFSDFLILSGNFGTSIDLPTEQPAQEHSDPGPAHLEVTVNDDNDIVISSDKMIAEIAYSANGKFTKIEAVNAKDYTLSVLGVTDLWVKSGVDAQGRDLWEHFVCPTDEVHAETLAKIDVTVDGEDQIVINSSETIKEIVYFVDGVATKVEGIDAHEFVLDQLNVTDLWVRAGHADSGRDYWEHFICPNDEGHGPTGEATVPSAQIEVLVNDQNDIVISSNETISEIVYLVDGQVTTISDVDSKDYTLSVLNVTDIWVKTGANDGGARDVWEHFVCPTDEVHAETLAKIDVAIDGEDQIVISSSETIKEIVYFVDGVATKVEGIDAHEFVLDQLNVTDLWVRAGHADSGRDYWEHFICPNDEGHGPTGEATVPSAQIEVLVNDQNDIVISSNETISEIVYLVDGQVTTISDVDSKDYTLSVLNVTDIWVKTGANDDGARDVWEHFVCPTDEVHGPAADIAEIEVTVDDQDQIVVSSSETIGEIVYVVNGMTTKITDINSDTYTLDVLGVTNLWVRSSTDHPSGREFWQHFVCPTDH